MKGLVIQGPLMSKGRTGKTANIMFENLSEDDIVNYNCLDNIEKLIKTYRENFDHIVCVTWRNQSESILTDLKNIFLEDELLLLEDNTKFIPPKGEVVPANNKNRQFLSTLEGMKKLETLGCEYAVKIRTDQFLNCSLLINQIVDLLDEEKYKETIFIPWLDFSSYYSVINIPDFYFGGKTSVVRRFCEKNLSEPDFFENIHLDIFYKWSCFDHEDLKYKLAVQTYIRLLGATGNNFFTRKIVKKSIGIKFYPLSSLIYESVYWRGEKLSIRNSLQFSETKSNWDNMPYLKLPKMIFKALRLGWRKVKHVYKSRKN